MTEKTNQVAFQAEIQQLLDILVHSLYTDQEIFLRELISNASDALSRLQFEMLTNQNVVDPNAKLEIRIEADEDENTLTIHDTGVGMTQEEMVENLGTIARSGAKSFLKAIEKTDKKAVSADIIGQFGVGFYSLFMVADEVSVSSRSFNPDAEPAVWKSEGKGTYSVEPGDKTERGTSITIKLKESAKEFSQTYRLRNIIKTHSDFVAFPVLLKEEKTAEGAEDGEEKEKTVEWNQVNEQTAIWRQSSTEIDEEKYKAFYQQTTFDFQEPILRIHTTVDAPVQFYTLLFIPSKKDYKLFGKDDHGLKLYARKVLIQENYKDLLPNYLRFIEGVVDCEDLPLNVSREAIQKNPLLEKIKRILVRRISNELKDMAEKDPDKYKTFWTEFGAFIKEGLATDPDSQGKFTDLLRFQSSKAETAEDLVSLADYASRMKDDQSEIYYILGDDYDVTSQSPHLDYFKKHEIEVLYLTDPLDSFMLTGLTEYNGKPLKNVDDAGLDLPEEEKTEEDEAETLPNDQFEALVERFKTLLKDRIEDVRESKILTDSPCRLVNPAGTPNSSMQRVQRLIGKDYQIPKKILEINRNNALIKNLATRLSENAEDDLVDTVAEQLFENALVSEGIHPNPAAMLPRIQKLMQLAAQTG